MELGRGGRRGCAGWHVGLRAWHVPHMCGAWEARWQLSCCVMFAKVAGWLVVDEGGNGWDVLALEGGIGAGVGVWLLAGFAVRRGKAELRRVAAKVQGVRPPATIRWVTFIAALMALGQGCLRLGGGSVSWKEGAHRTSP
jgi:hypothetical protein